MWRLGRSIGGGSLSINGGGRPDRVREVSLVLLSHYSSGPLLGDFPADCDFLSGGPRSGFVLDVEESPVKLTVCQLAA